MDQEQIEVLITSALVAGGLEITEHDAEVILTSLKAKGWELTYVGEDA